MPKQLSPDLDERLRQALSSTDRGSGIEAIHRTLGPALSRRTLLRRLTALVESGVAIAEGLGKARRYRLMSPPDAEEAPTASSPATIGPAEYDEDIGTLRGMGMFAPENAPLRAYVRRAESARRRVGYHRDFLLRYVPNQSAYLSEPLRQHLADVGQLESADWSPVGRDRQVLDAMLIDLCWESSRLEGVSCARTEAEALFRLGRAIEGAAPRDGQTLLNHRSAYEFVIRQPDLVGFNRYTLTNLHGLLAEDLVAEPETAGRLRAGPLRVNGSVYLPLSSEAQVDECFGLVLEKASQIRDPFERSFFALVHLSYLLPFASLNKRTARVAANIPLMAAGYCPHAFSELPRDAYVEGLHAIFELCRVDLMRDVYVWSYERSAARLKSLREAAVAPDPFRRRWREALIEAIGTVVRTPTIERQRVLDAVARRLVDEPERNRFIAMASAEIDGLHEGVLARYRIRPAEFEDWRHAAESRAA